METTIKIAPAIDKANGRIVGAAEVATVTFDGKPFTNLGAVVMPEYAVGYLKCAMPGFVGSRVVITAFDGTELGSGVVTGRWSTPRSFISSHQYQVKATINGIVYTGRTAGNGMIWKGKKSK